MKNPPTKHISPLKKVLFVILAIPGLFILYLLGSYALDPLLDSIEKTRFEKLDTQSRELFDVVKTASNGAEEWVYDASCEPERSGWLPTGGYDCQTSISTIMPVTSVAQLNALHGKYFPIIDGSKTLTAVTDLDKQFPDKFGLQFVVSSAEKRYNPVDNDKITCDYLVELAQPEEDSATEYNQHYSSPIETGIGRVLISLTCNGKASGDWYGESS